jgi:hypothetical protein
MKKHARKNVLKKLKLRLLLLRRRNIMVRQKKMIRRMIRRCQPLTKVIKFYLELPTRRMKRKTKKRPPKHKRSLSRMAFPATPNQQSHVGNHANIENLHEDRNIKAHGDNENIQHHRPRRKHRQITQRKMVGALLGQPREEDSEVVVAELEVPELIAVPRNYRVSRLFSFHWRTAVP